MGVVGKAGLAKSAAMHLIRFITALVVVAQRFAFLVRQQISRQLAAAAAVVMVAHQLVVAAAAPQVSPVVEATVVVAVLSRQEEREETPSD
jgi:hypothetical protein